MASLYVPQSDISAHRSACSHRDMRTDSAPYAMCDGLCFLTATAEAADDSVLANAGSLAAAQPADDIPAEADDVDDDTESDSGSVYSESTSVHEKDLKF
jgi:hypothetical protein